MDNYTRTYGSKKLVMFTHFRSNNNNVYSIRDIWHWRVFLMRILSIRERVKTVGINVAWMLTVCLQGVFFVIVCIWFNIWHYTFAVCRYTGAEKLSRSGSQRLCGLRYGGEKIGWSLECILGVHNVLYILYILKTSL